MSEQQQQQQLLLQQQQMQQQQMQQQQVQPFEVGSSQQMDDSPQEGQWSGLGCACSCVDTGNVGVVQYFGRYVGYTEPGVVLYCPPFHSVTPLSVATVQMDCKTDCKTKDNVTLTVHTAVQYKIDKTRIRSAMFEIEDPQSQVTACVDDVVRSSVPSLNLDDVYSNKDELTYHVKRAVSTNMTSYGFDVLNVLITDLTPDNGVLQAMNQINAAKRNRQAAEQQGEGQKVLQVKAAEAEADSKFLSGQGSARMRVAMATGFKDSMMSMCEGGLSPQESMHMMITTQYLDTLENFARNSTKSSIMVPHGPGAVSQIHAQTKQGFAAAAIKPGQQKM